MKCLQPTLRSRRAGHKKRRCSVILYPRRSAWTIIHCALPQRESQRVKNLQTLVDEFLVNSNFSWEETFSWMHFKFLFVRWDILMNASQTFWFLWDETSHDVFWKGERQIEFVLPPTIIAPSLKTCLPPQLRSYRLSNRTRTRWWHRDRW